MRQNQQNCLIWILAPKNTSFFHFWTTFEKIGIEILIFPSKILICCRTSINIWIFTPKMLQKLQEINLQHNFSNYLNFRAKNNWKKYTKVICIRIKINIWIFAPKIFLKHYRKNNFLKYFKIWIFSLKIIFKTMNLHHIIKKIFEFSRQKYLKMTQKKSALELLYFFEFTRQKFKND